MSAVAELSGSVADVVTGVDVGGNRDAWCSAVVRTVTEAVAAGQTDLSGWVRSWRQGEIEPPDPDLDQSYLDQLNDLVAAADGRYDELTLAQLDDELRGVGAASLAGTWDQVAARAVEWRWQRCLAEASATPWDGGAESWPDFHQAATGAAQRWRVSAEMAGVLDGGYDALHQYGLVLPAEEDDDPSGESPPAGDVRGLAWVTVVQQEAITGAAGAAGHSDWHAWLLTTLDSMAPGWSAAAGVDAAWLDGWLPTLTATGVPVLVEEPPLTEEQLAELEADEARDVDESGRALLDDTDFSDDELRQLVQTQEVLGLVPDGVVGPKTWDAMLQAAEELGIDVTETDDETDDEDQELTVA